MSLYIDSWVYNVKSIVIFINIIKTERLWPLLFLTVCFILPGLKYITS